MKKFNNTLIKNQQRIKVQLTIALFQKSKMERENKGHLTNTWFYPLLRQTPTITTPIPPSNHPLPTLLVLLLSPVVYRLLS